MTVQHLHNISRALKAQADQRPHAPALTYLTYGDQPEPQRTELTYGTLFARAAAFARQLSGVTRPGDRVMLLHASGTDFAVQFFGALLAGTVPVPAPEPQVANARAAERLVGIVEDADVSAVGVPRHLAIADVRALSPRFASLAWLTNDDSAEAAGDLPGLDADRDGVAYLQYTSGSTGSPKGIQITHGNVLGQAEALAAASKLDSDSVAVTWVPVFHDLGLIFGVLTPLLNGCHCVALAPYAFIRDPGRWLRAISDFGGTHSAAPNFAYDLCVRRMTPAQRAGLDLSCWHVAYNAAEPVRPETLDRFVAEFAPYGLPADAMTPAYGLAEATLGVTATAGRVKRFHACRDAMRTGRAVPDPSGRTLVSNGPALPGVDLRIVEPERQIELPEGRVGEIWVGGWTVAAGLYGQNGDATFRARLAGGSAPFLRTGDLGFLYEGELYITGRRKDVIIVRGQNFHPEDLEQVAEAADPLLVNAGAYSAAFPLSLRDGEGTAIVCEVKGKATEQQLAEAAQAIRGRIGEVFQIVPQLVALVHPGEIPKTSSGKRRRGECGLRLAGGDLRVRYLLKEEERKANDDQPQPQSALPAVAMKPVLRLMLGRIVGLPGARLGDQVPFAEYGLDSVGAQELCGELERLLGRAVPATLIFDHPTIADLAGALETPVS